MGQNFCSSPQVLSIFLYISPALKLILSQNFHVAILSPYKSPRPKVYHIVTIVYFLIYDKKEKSIPFIRILLATSAVPRWDECRKCKFTIFVQETVDHIADISRKNLSQKALVRMPAAFFLFFFYVNKLNVGTKFKINTDRCTKNLEDLRPIDVPNEKADPLQYRFIKIYLCRYHCGTKK